MYASRVKGEQQAHKLVNVHRSRTIRAHALLLQNAHDLFLHIKVFLDFLHKRK